MTSISKKARIAGALYILASAVGFLRLIYIPSTLIVPGNATATAGNITSHEFLFRMGIITYLFGAVLWSLVPLALYRLLSSVDQALAVLMVILGSLMTVPIFLMNSVNDGAALLFARREDFLSVFSKPQRDALAMLFLRLHHQGDLANQILWGVWLIPFGLLVYKSRFLPRLLGIWLIVGCFGYLAMTFTGFLYPAYEDKAFTYMQPLVIGELAMMLWLVIRGAKELPPSGLS